MVCMATSWNVRQGSKTSLSQNKTNLEQDEANKDGGCEKNDKLRDINYDDSETGLSPMRQRSFSDVSYIRYRHRRQEKNDSDHERKQSMKVIICRESKVLMEPERGRSNQAKIQSPGTAGKRQILSRSKSAHGHRPYSGVSPNIDDDIPPPKPKLPESYRINYSRQQFRNLNPDRSQSEVQESQKDFYLTSTEKLLPNTERDTLKGRKKIISEYANVQLCEELRKSGDSGRQQIDCKTRDKISGEIESAQSLVERKYVSNDTNLIRESKVIQEVIPSERQLNEAHAGRKIFRSDSKVALFRSYDAKLRAIALKRELDTLRSSEHVRQRLCSTEHYEVADLKKDTVRQTDGPVSTSVASNDRTKQNIQPAVDFRKDTWHEIQEKKLGAKTPSEESKNYELHKNSNPYNKYRNEIPHFSDTVRSQNLSGASREAYPPSGAHTEANIHRGANRINQRYGTAREKIDEKGRQNKQPFNSSLQRRNSRSKSESSLIRKAMPLDSRAIAEPGQRDDTYLIKDRGDNSKAFTLAKSVSYLSRGDNLQERKSTSQIKRKQDTIRKFHYDSFAQMREKIRTNYKKKPDLSESESPQYADLSIPKIVLPELSDDGASLGDNRSDEEKYAALSRSKIVHTKSSSLDSHLEPNKKVRHHKTTIHPVIKLASSSSLPDYRSSPIDTSFLLDNTSSSSDSLDVYLSENKGVKHEKFNTDILPLPKERLKVKTTDLKSEQEGKIAQGGKNSTQQKVVLRQCRIGSDVAFSLVGLKKSEPEPNGNGFLDGQGLVTLRMIPDEQGRFGFNVKGGADQGMPIIVSRVAPNTPADNCIPRLNEGDQVLFINGRDVSQHTHEQVVMFIRASRETHSGELVLKIRPNVYTGDDNMDEPDLVYDPDTHQISSGASGANALEVSLKVLEESLESGAALAQFEQLYRKKPGMTMNAARLENNIPKNRYRDISPYDQTRVVIKNGTSGDYINANYVNMEIPVSGIVNRYIAAQGPLPTTCTDFWQMVWEQQSTLVVMLTTKVERGRIKCHQYWPDNYETSDFGTLQITCVKEEESSSFAFREFNLTNVETNEERHISHMQYIAWPDHGVPDDPADFLEFVIKVRQKRVGIVEPVIVHCSAGIGRTGVLITMETAMCLIEANQPVYPLSIVRQMRDQRAMLIQTPSQYKFVCEAINKSYNEAIVKPLPEYQR